MTMTMRGLKMNCRIATTPRAAGLIAGLIAATVAAGSAAADEVADFYAGQTVRMIIGYPPGGSNDIYARVVATHLGKYIPGAPRIVATNMPGAGSINAANHLFHVAPKDGTILGAISHGLPLQAKLGQGQTRYDAAKFNWIGRMAASSSVTMVWHTSKIMRFDDTLRTEVTLGASGVGSTPALYPSVMNELLKTKFKLVMGYKGSTEAMLAMERGEVEGHSTTWEVVKAVHPDWITGGKIRLLVQHGLRRNRELAGIPTSVELAAEGDNRAAMRVIMSANEIGKSYFTTPGVPPARITALRRAFDAMVKDPQFAEAVAKIRGEIDALTGEEVQEMVAELDRVPPALLARVKTIYVEQ
jgi:tripartite-type tricarboxylate transporter receptor subunit TctC